MRSVMSHSFSQVPSVQIPRSRFDRSHGLKTTFDSGLLIPILVDEALPGDSFSLRTSSLVRMATPLYPVMDNITISTFFFAIPERLVFDNFKRMMGEQKDPGDSTDYVFPKITSPAGGYQELSIYDFMGLPTKVENLTHRADFLRSYNLVWNEWFRDQNLQDSLDVPTDDGPDLDTTYTLQRRGKRHDYFTSALPWPQKGPAVDIPLGTSAPIIAQGNLGDNVRVLDTDGVTELNLQSTTYVQTASAFGTSSLLTADLQSATAATINQLRQAFQIQKMFEKDARGGSRYTEIVRQHFSVISPDARLQRPEYLGGGVSKININPVVSKTDTDPLNGGRPLGDLAATATAAFSNHGFSKSFTEHCIILGLCSIQADLTYQQGLNRMWSRDDRYDLYWPSLAFLGEQEILNKEIYADGSSNDEEVFGYQERYAEYRYKPSQITGQFRSNAQTPLDAWHLSQEFSQLPTLSAAFIEDNPPIDRVIATPNEPQFIADFYHKMICARPMPVYGVPGNIDRF